MFLSLICIGVRGSTMLLRLRRSRNSTHHYIMHSSCKKGRVANKKSNNSSKAYLGIINIEIHHAEMQLHKTCKSPTKETPNRTSTPSASPAPQASTPPNSSSSPSSPPHQSQPPWYISTCSHTYSPYACQHTSCKREVNTNDKLTDQYNSPAP
jgi:hypothetical protein